MCVKVRNGVCAWRSCGRVRSRGQGEGGDANHTRAVELYEAAAAAGSSRALNGLGYEYFFGHVLQKDAERAYGYFAEAARLGEASSEWRGVARRGAAWRGVA